MPRRAAMSARRAPYAPLTATSRRPPAGTAEPMTASLPKVPLPCISTAEYSGSAWAGQGRAIRLGVGAGPEAV